MAVLPETRHLEPQMSTSWWHDRNIELITKVGLLYALQTMIASRDGNNKKYTSEVELYGHISSRKHPLTQFSCIFLAC